MKKIIKYFAMIVCVFAFAFTITACKDDTPVTPDTPGGGTGEGGDNPGGGTGGDSGVVDDGKVTYQVHVTAVSGKPLQYFNVILSKDGKIVEEEYTDVNGYADFRLEKDIYKITVEFNDGYEPESDATLYTDSTGETLVTEVRCNQYLIMDTMPEGTTYSQGDSMYDFSYIDTETKEEITLSGLLEDNDLVVLNFWYSDCSWCITEFPLLEQAYEAYKDNGVAVVAVNPGAQVSSNDSASDINEFKSTNGLTFPCVIDTTDTGLLKAFNIGSFPTTVFVDRYGVAAMIESGAITTLSKWTSMFADFLGDDYETPYESNEIAIPTTTYPGDDVIAGVANAVGNNYVTYSTETNSTDAKYNWPWVIDEQTNSIKPSNYKINNSYSILYMNVSIKANEVLAFDYKASTEVGADYLYILLNSRTLGVVSGISEDFETKYIYVASQDEDITIALCYMKDTSGYDGDDTILINNVRTVGISEVDAPTYIIRDCAIGDENPFTNKYEDYVDVELGSDGYYHLVETGQLVLANLIDGYTKFADYSMYEAHQDGQLDFTADGGNDYSDMLLKYMLYANNSTITNLGLSTSGLTPVTQELYEALNDITTRLGIVDGGYPEQWLELCVYIDQYGTDGEDMIGDPIKGLALFSAYEAKEGVNSVTYDRLIVPRGLYNKFVPTKDGVYKIYSTGDLETDCFIFDAEGNMIKTVDAMNLEFREFYQNVYKDLDTKNFFTYIHLNAGEVYYVAPCYWNTAQTGTISFNIDYVAENVDKLRVCAYATFTYALSDESSSIEDYTILANKTIDIAYDLVNDCYHPVIDGQIQIDKYIYLDVAYVTGVFGDRNLVNVMENGGFDFTKDELGYSVFDKFTFTETTENDTTTYTLTYKIGSYTSTYSYVYDATTGAITLTLTSDEDYFGTDTNKLKVVNNQLVLVVGDVEFTCVKDTTEDSFTLVGSYTCYIDEAVDKTELAQNYIQEAIDDETSDMYGLVVVNKELAALLQQLMDKYTFAGVEESWLKLCYYYESL